MKICVFGASSDYIPEIYLSSARRFGELIAEGGHTLVFGAGNHGVMGEAARGAKSKDGDIIGAAPKFFDVGDTLYPECTELIYSETMRERKAVLEDIADAFAVLPGGVGTYEEFFEVFVLCQIGQMKKPIVVLNINGCYDRLSGLLHGAVDEKFMEEDALSLAHFADSVESAYEFLTETSL